MIGRQEGHQIELFVYGTLWDRRPDDHVLVGVDRVLDLGWLSGDAMDWVLRTSVWTTGR